MSVPILPLNEMSVEEKLQTMEALWQSLSGDPAAIESPAWHEDELAERERKIESGEAKFVEWEKAKADIRRRTSCGLSILRFCGGPSHKGEFNGGGTCDEISWEAFVITAYEPSLEVFESDYRTGKSYEQHQSDLPALRGQKNQRQNHLQCRCRQWGGGGA